MGKQTSISILNPSHTVEIDKFKKWLIQKRYSTNTIKTYIHMLEMFFNYYNEKQITEISKSDIIQFNYEFVIKRKYSNSFQNQMINAIKLFYKKSSD